MPRKKPEHQDSPGKSKRKPVTRGPEIDEPEMVSHHTTDQANVIDEMNEDIPNKPAPAKNLPELHNLPEPEEELKKVKTDKYDKAMKILDEYSEGVPIRKPTLEHEED